MNLGLLSPERLPPTVLAELEQIIAAINTSFAQQHTVEGAHGDITADSIGKASPSATNVLELLSGQRWMRGPWLLEDDGNTTPPDQSSVRRVAQITANQNDYEPPGLAAAILLELDSDAARTLTGLKASRRQRRILFLMNRGSFTITLSHNSSSSAAANRFSFPGAVDASLRAGDMTALFYDVGSQLWRPFALGVNNAVATDVQIFTSSGTWTKPAGAVAVDVTCVGGGGGGGGGRRGAAGTDRYGGGGGGGGGWVQVTLQASLLAATESVTVGGGGAAGNGATSDDTNGSAGVAGGISSFGTWARAGGGINGGGGTSAGNTGTASATDGIGVSTGGLAGQDGSVAGSSYLGGGGGGDPNRITTADGYTTHSRAGGAATGPNRSGGAGGANGGANNGTAGTGATTNEPSGGGGGGAGGSNTGGAAGHGAAGGLYGGGGGGGGAAANGANAGNGGAGAAGIVLVRTTS